MLNILLDITNSSIIRIYFKNNVAEKSKGVYDQLNYKKEIKIEKLVPIF